MAGEGSSSAWAGRGAAVGEVADAAAAANTSREAVGAGCGDADQVCRGITEG